MFVNTRWTLGPLRVHPVSNSSSRLSCIDPLRKLFRKLLFLEHRIENTHFGAPKISEVGPLGSVPSPFLRFLFGTAEKSPP